MIEQLCVPFLLLCRLGSLGMDNEHFGRLSDMHSNGNGWIQRPMYGVTQPVFVHLHEI